MKKEHYEVEIKCGNCGIKAFMILPLGEKIIDTMCPNCEVTGKLLCQSSTLIYEPIDLTNKKNQDEKNILCTPNPTAGNKIPW